MVSRKTWSQGNSVQTNGSSTSLRPANSSSPNKPASCNLLSLKRTSKSQAANTTNTHAAALDASSVENTAPKTVTKRTTNIPTAKTATKSAKTTAAQSHTAKESSKGAFKVNADDSSTNADTAPIQMAQRKVLRLKRFNKTKSEVAAPISATETQAETKATKTATSATSTATTTKGSVKVTSQKENTLTAAVGVGAVTDNSVNTSASVEVNTEAPEENVDSSLAYHGNFPKNEASWNLYQQLKEWLEKPTKVDLNCVPEWLTQVWALAYAPYCQPEISFNLIVQVLNNSKLLNHIALTVSTWNGEHALESELWAGLYASRSFMGKAQLPKSENRRRYMVLKQKMDSAHEHWQRALMMGFEPACLLLERLKAYQETLEDRLKHGWFDDTNQEQPQVSAATLAMFGAPSELSGDEPLAEALAKISQPLSHGYYQGYAGAINALSLTLLERYANRQQGVYLDVLDHLLCGLPIAIPNYNDLPEYMLQILQTVYASCAHHAPQSSATALASAQAQEVAKSASAAILAQASTAKATTGQALDAQTAAPTLITAAAQVPAAAMDGSAVNQIPWYHLPWLYIFSQRLAVSREFTLDQNICLNLRKTCLQALMLPVMQLLPLYKAHGKANGNVRLSSGKLPVPVLPGTQAGVLARYRNEAKSEGGTDGKRDLSVAPAQTNLNTATKSSFALLAEQLASLPHPASLAGQVLDLNHWVNESTALAVLCSIAACYDLVCLELNSLKQLSLDATRSVTGANSVTGSDALKGLGATKGKVGIRASTRVGLSSGLSQGRGLDYGSGQTYGLEQAHVQVRLAHAKANIGMDKNVLGRVEVGLQLSEGLSKPEQQLLKIVQTHLEYFLLLQSTALGTPEQRAAGWHTYQELVGTYKLNVKEFLRKLEHNPAACFMLSWLYLTGIATHTDYAVAWDYLNRSYELIALAQPQATPPSKPALEAKTSSATKAQATTATKATTKSSTAKSKVPRGTSFLESILQSTKQLQKQNDACLKTLTNFVQSSDDKFNHNAAAFVPLDAEPYTDDDFTQNVNECAATSAYNATAMRSNDETVQDINDLNQSMNPDLAQNVQAGKSKAHDMRKPELTEQTGKTEQTRKTADERSKCHNGGASSDSRDSGKDSMKPSPSTSRGKVRLSLHRDHKPKADEVIPDSNQNSSNLEPTQILVATADELEQNTDSQQAATKKATSKKVATKQADSAASERQTDSHKIAAMQAALSSALACQAGLQALPAQLQLNGLTIERDKVAALNFFQSLTADNKSLDLAALGVDILAQSSESAQGKATKAKSNAKSAKDKVKDKSKDKSKDKLSAQNKAVLNLMANPAIVPTAWGYEYLLPQIYALQAGMLLRGFGTGQNQRLALTAIEQCGACMSEAKVPYVMSVVKAINQLWPYLDTPDESFAHYVNRLAHSGDVAARVMFGLSLGYGLLGQAINLKQAQYWLSISEKQGAKAQVINKKFYAAVQQRIKG